MREIAEIELAIQGGTEKIETLGEQGKVDESMREMAAIEALKSEKAEKERELQQLTDTSGASGHQKLRVCDVCGAYLSVLDSDRRLADHFGGKVSPSNVLYLLTSTYACYRCILATMSFATCLRSSRKNVRSASRVLHPLGVGRQDLCRRWAHLEGVNGTTDQGMITRNVTGDTNVTAPRAMSAYLIPFLM